MNIIAVYGNIKIAATNLLHLRSADFHTKIMSEENYTEDKLLLKAAILTFRFYAHRHEALAQPANFFA